MLASLSKMLLRAVRRNMSEQGKRVQRGAEIPGYRTADNSSREEPPSLRLNAVMGPNGLQLSQFRSLVPSAAGPLLSFSSSLGGVSESAIASLIFTLCFRHRSSA